MVGTGITVTGNFIHEGGSYGVGGTPPFPLVGSPFDLIIVTENVLEHNGMWGIGGGSGISLYELTLGSGSDLAGGYRARITRNLIRNSRESVPETYAGNTWADGNGIIIDDTKHTQNGGAQGAAYTGRILIADNVILDSTGAGAHVFESDHVDVIHNTLFANSQVTPSEHNDGTNGPGSGGANNPAVYGHMGCYAADDINFVNNIVVTEDNHSYAMYSTAGSTNVNADYNLYFTKAGGAAGIAVSGAHDVIGDPLFINEALDASADLRLQPGSPALNAATATYAPLATDANATQTGIATDLGAPDLSIIYTPPAETSRALPQVMMVGLGVGASIPVVYAIWDSADAHSGADLLISGGGKTIHHANNGTPAFIRTTTHHTKGSAEKLHFEFTAGATGFNGGNSAPWILGLSKVGTTPASFFGDSTDAVVYQNWTAGNGIAYLNATAVYTTSPAQTHAGDTVAIEWDTGAHTFKINVNGAGWSTPLDVSTMSAGDWCIAYYSSESGDAFTLNTGETPFAIPMSAGDVVAWDS